MKHIEIIKETERPNGNGSYKVGTRLECQDATADSWIKAKKARALEPAVQTLEQVAEKKEEEQDD